MGQRASSYVLTLGAVALLTALKLTYDPIGAQLPFILYLPVVLGAAWHGGRGPGIVAIVVSALVASYFFIEPVHAYTITRVTLVQTGVFVLESSGILLLVDLNLVQRAKEHALTQRLEVLARATTSSRRR